MRVLWLSPCVLTDRDQGGGSWLRAAAPHLLRTGMVTLGNVALAPVSSSVRQDYREVCQWLIPGVHNSRKNYVPAKSTVEMVVKAAKEFQPDLVHVWGTEYFWGLLTARKHLAYPSLLEIQGLKRPSSRVFEGGLSWREILSCTGVREILRNATIFHLKKKFADWAPIENEIIANHSNIAAQSLWVEAWVRSVNPTCNLFHTELPLRDSFYESQPWESTGSFSIFTSANSSPPSKGLHDAIRAIAILRDRIPSVRLKIAGGHQLRGHRRQGYIKWLEGIIRKNGLSGNVEWLGPLTASQIVEVLKGCGAAVVPSHCETYCVAFAEAMFLGVPVVTSFSGGTAWLGKDEDTALFYPAGDEIMCAHQLWRVLSDSKLAEDLSRRGRETALARNDPRKIAENQVQIYRSVLNGK